LLEKQVEKVRTGSMRIHPSMRGASYTDIQESEAKKTEDKSPSSFKKSFTLTFLSKDKKKDDQSK